MSASITSPRARSVGVPFAATLAAILVAGFAVRCGYVAAQPAGDPSFDRPMLDGAYYLDWARSLASGQGGPEGAHYLAPLYAYVLAGFLKGFGERFALLYLVQHAMIVAAAGFVALAGRRLWGEGAGLAAAGVLLLYHPLLYFASRPLAESLAVALLSASVWLATRAGRGWSAGAGVAVGLASLARSNLLLVGLCWSCVDLARRRWRGAGLLVAGIASVVVPVTLRNLAVSGHPVMISSNAGITFFHGNGPGAVGIYTPPTGTSGNVSEQRGEATAWARAATGRELDAVEADRWWGRRAMRTRLENPGESMILLLRRVGLLVSSREISLDYAPGIDRNPFRWLAPVPFAALLGLGVAGLVLRAPPGGGHIPWGAVLGCAATPLVFYVSSRYRLPGAAMLCLPAGAAIAALAGPGRGSRRLVAAVALACAAVSALVPVGPTAASARAAALSNRGAAWLKAGDAASARLDLRDALALDPASVPALFNLGTLHQVEGRSADAETAFRRALALDPESAEAAGNLAKILIETGRAGEAVPILSRALDTRPTHRVAWNNLIVALAAAGNVEAAREAARSARARGVSLNAELLHSIRVGGQQEQEKKGGVHHESPSSKR